jgi:hypothetical protein
MPPGELDPDALPVALPAEPDADPLVEPEPRLPLPAVFNRG